MNVAIHKRLELAINASGLTDDQIRKKAEISKSRYHEIKKGDGRTSPLKQGFLMSRPSPIVKRCFLHIP